MYMFHLVQIYLVIFRLEPFGFDYVQIGTIWAVLNYHKNGIYSYTILIFLFAFTINFIHSINNIRWGCLD